MLFCLKQLLLFINCLLKDLHKLDARYIYVLYIYLIVPNLNFVQGRAGQLQNSIFRLLEVVWAGQYVPGCRLPFDPKKVYMQLEVKNCRTQRPPEASKTY